jgi:hypothetical protein
MLESAGIPPSDLENKLVRAQSILEALFGGSEVNEALRQGDHLAASQLLLQPEGDAVKIIETLMCGAAIAIFASRRPGAPLEEITVILERVLYDSIETVLEQAHSMLHSGDERLVKSPFVGSMFGTVTRGLSEKNELGTVEHGELIAFLDGPLKAKQDAVMAIISERVAARKAEAQPTEAPKPAS